MDEKTALDEIQFIKKIIEESKITFIYNGMGYIFWGIIVVAGLIVNYFSIIYKWGISSISIWLIVTSGGWIFSFYSYYFKRADIESEHFQVRF